MTTLAVDTFTQFALDYVSPMSNVFLITPNDTNDLAYVTRAIRANAAGSVAVITYADWRTARETGSTPGSVIIHFAAGETRDLRISRVLATGTTAAMGLEGMY